MLRLVGIGVLAAVAAGWIAGGRLRRLAELPVVAMPLTFASAGLVVTARFVGDPIAGFLQTGAIVSAGTFLLINAARSKGVLRAAIGLLLIGWIMNATVILANDGMPLSLKAYEASGQTELPTPGEEEFFAITVAGEDTKLGFLGDVIPIAPMRIVVSLGDLVMVLGMIAVVTVGMRSRKSDSRTTRTSYVSDPEVSMTTT